MRVRQAVGYGLPYAQYAAILFRIFRKEAITLETVFVGLASFVGGALVSWVNYLLLRRLMDSKGETGIGLASPVRTIMSTAYLVILYYIGKRTGFSLAALLIGGALGMTAMLVFFTLRLTGGTKGQRKE